MDKGYDPEEIQELIQIALTPVPLFRSGTENVNGSSDITEDGSLSHSMRKRIIKEIRLKRYSPS